MGLKERLKRVLLILLHVMMMAGYLHLMYLQNDAHDRLHIRQAVIHQYLGPRTREGRMLASGAVLGEVREILGSLYQPTGLHWGHLLQQPKIRQVRSNLAKCRIRNAPPESCYKYSLSWDEVNRTCFRCRTSPDSSPQVCFSDEGDKVQDNCKNGCDNGFGFCRGLGQWTVLGRARTVFPPGGQGLHLKLDKWQSWRGTLLRLEEKTWIDNHTLLVSLDFSALIKADTLLCITVYFMQLKSRDWIMSYDLTIDRIPGFFAFTYEVDGDGEGDVSEGCARLSNIVTRRAQTDKATKTAGALLLLLSALMITLEAIETPHISWVRGQHPRPTSLDHFILAVNILLLVAHSGVCFLHFHARMLLMENLCDKYYSFVNISAYVNAASTLHLLIFYLLIFKLMLKMLSQQLDMSVKILVIATLVLSVTILLVVAGITAAIIASIILPVKMTTTILRASLYIITTSEILANDDVILPEKRAAQLIVLWVVLPLIVAAVWHHAFIALQQAYLQQQRQQNQNPPVI